jgi:2-methylcitrate dehydratase PrpD
VIEAQFSLRFSLALRLLEGNNDLQHYLDSKMWSDPRILEIGNKIELLADPTAIGERRFACQMRIHLSDGKEVYGSLAAPKGSYKNPLTESELHEKFYRLGRSVLDDDKLSSVIASVEGIEKSDDVGVISSLMTAAA